MMDSQLSVHVSMPFFLLTFGVTFVARSAEWFDFRSSPLIAGIHLRRKQIERTLKYILALTHLDRSFSSLYVHAYPVPPFIPDFLE
jgi:hypothetical protein